MEVTVDNRILEPPGGNAAGLLDAAVRGGAPRSLSASRPGCFHCSEPCPNLAIRQDEKVFCCHGCRLVHDLLAENGLGEFYRLSRHPGVKIRGERDPGRWAYLDEPAVYNRLLDFTNGKTSRVTFHIPGIHCVACVWLLENLFRLHPGIGRSQVNFPRREVAIQFSPQELSLAGVAALLASIGYEPRLTLGELEPRRADPAMRRRWLQLGVAGFAFGNTMLLTVPLYFGLDEFNGPVFRVLFGWLGLALAAPVLVYSASDYWRSAWLSVRQRVLTLDVPIALGLAALYAQSVWEIASGRGAGYLDSLVGLVFFLLCGRVFQQKTQERMVFDRDYKCFFPLAVTRKQVNEQGRSESISISSVCLGDRLLVRNGELIPADARLVSGAGCIDYSFVTGEAEPVDRAAGDSLYAGGKQIGGTIEIETIKPVSQSYLTSLWDHAAFRKERAAAPDTLTYQYSRRFTVVVIAVAIVAGLAWLLAGDAARGLTAFVSVLIVACPCALALAAPFTLGTAQRLLARVQVFLKNALVLERMARVDTVVFDKTGTLTAGELRGLIFADGLPLTPSESRHVYSLASYSIHPHSVRIANALTNGEPALPVQSFAEAPGCGIEGLVEGQQVRLGSRAWLCASGLATESVPAARSGTTCLAVNGAYRGTFCFQHALRPETTPLLRKLGRQCELALLSGDNEQEAERFRQLFGLGARLSFNQSPLDKLGFIGRLQAAGKTVMMVGDGLNDAGALKQSDVGVAVVNGTGAFSPASDVILDGRQVPALDRVLGLARRSTRIVRASLAISAGYNLVGISIAATGSLSPLICALLMPLSSISVVLFACGMTAWAARKEGLACL